MTKPVVVSIPHRLGREEAARRLRAGLGRVQNDFGHVLTVQNQTWTGDNHLDFSVRALGQTASGQIDVAEDHVRLEVSLPTLLAWVAEKARTMIDQRGRVLLENKSGEPKA